MPAVNRIGKLIGILGFSFVIGIGIAAALRPYQDNPQVFLFMTAMITIYAFGTIITVIAHDTTLTSFISPLQFLYSFFVSTINRQCTALPTPKSRYKPNPQTHLLCF
jgi:hypothetical protein